MNKFRFLGVLCAFAVILIAVFYLKGNRKEKEEILTMGLNKGQEKYFQEQLQQTGEFFGYIQKGKMFLKEGDVTSAVKQFEIALSNAYSPVTKAEAYLYLADAYEKAKDYRNAYDMIVRSSGGSVVPPTHIVRVPKEARKKYLEYASKGEYELAIEYAQKALEADAKLPNRPKTGRQDYIDRLNDLIAAKDYIESLK
jgi:tetratricopeptide (TPR) repeat protein